ncbi:hypothetical protein [uncultured Clostridium sp.]|jgi:hypothetical protein|uniref:hypothetical protein n=1 Tax=uncultured Clostridium sp. TaxID=59620 RepID=UPI00262A79CE|nr:hypothetical protein [uncultured Clostridium sp.]
MKLEFKSRKKNMRKNMIKYLTVKDGEVSFSKKLTLSVALIFKTFFMKNIVKTIELTNDLIIFSNDKLGVIEIRYDQIQNILIDEDDIIVLNSVMGFLIPSYAFNNSLERDSFISILKNNYEWSQKKASSTNKEDNSPIYEDINSTTIKPTIIDLNKQDTQDSFSCKLPKYLYIKYKYQEITRSITKNRHSKIKFIILIALSLISLIGQQVYNLGGLTQILNTFLSISLPLIWILGIAFMFIIPNIKLRKKLERRFNKNSIEYNLKINDLGIILNDGYEENQILFTKMTHIKIMLKSIYIAVTDSPNLIIIPKELFEKETDKGSVFYQIKENIMHPNRVSKARKSSGRLTVVIIVLAIICFNTQILTYNFISTFTPNYYHTISANRVVRMISNIGSELGSRPVNSSVNNNSQNTNLSNDPNGALTKPNAISDFVGGLQFVVSPQSNSIFHNISNTFDKYKLNAFIKETGGNTGISYNYGSIPYIQTVYSYLQLADSQMLNRNMEQAQRSIKLAIAYSNLMNGILPSTIIAQNAVMSIQAAYYMIKQGNNGYSMYSYLSAQIPSNSILSIIGNANFNININGVNKHPNQIFTSGIEYNNQTHKFFKTVFLGYQDTANYKILKVYTNGNVETINITTPEKIAQIEKVNKTN